ncbi:MAG TPA: hypothetical protein VL689_17110 [Paraburkholderia sp.]|jgi:hypothetical protein|nr:hypothetical protein [Paraburkholderia sp.]
MGISQQETESTDSRFIHERAEHASRIGSRRRVVADCLASFFLWDRVVNRIFAPADAIDFMCAAVTGKNAQFASVKIDWLSRGDFLLRSRLKTRA